MQKYFLFLIVNCCCFCGVVAQSTITTTNSFTIAQTNYDIDIPFEYINGVIYLPVNINNNEYRFMFDTGSCTMISQDVFKSLNLEALSSENMRDANGFKLESAISVLSHLSIGALEFKDLKVSLLPNSFINCDDFNGVIGSDIFNNSIVQICYKKRMIRVTNDRKNIHVKNKHKYLMALSENFCTPYIRVKLANGKNSAFGEFMFDTGDSRLINLSQQFIDFFLEREIIRLKDTAIGTSGFGFSGKLKDTVQCKYIVPNLGVNKGYITNVIGLLSNFSTIGCKLIEYGDVTLDYRNKSFAYVPYQDIIEYIDNSYPIDISYQNNRLYIGTIWGDNYNGVSVGDQIIEVNGLNCDSISICELINNPFTDNPKMSLKIKDKSGNIKLIEMFKNSNIKY